MLQTIKNTIQNTSDLKNSFFALILPAILMIIWQINNSGLPNADANDFIGASGVISNYFYEGEIFRGIYELYAGKPFRPLSFHLILFPFMLISNNNILFTAACVHILCLSFIIIYAYYIFRIISDCKTSCLLSATSIGLLSSSFFPGGTLLFAEVGLTPAILATIYHLYSSRSMAIKKQSIYALIAMLLAFTIRPLMSLTQLMPIIIFFFYVGYRNKIFSLKLIYLIIKIIASFVLILSMSGINIDIVANGIYRGNWDSIDAINAHNYYEILFKAIIIFTLVIYIPKILSEIKYLYFYILNYKKENNTYALIIFTLLPFIMFIWLLDSWRDLFSWIYRTQFGDIAQVTNINSSFIQLNSINEVFIKFYNDFLLNMGALPYIIFFLLSITALFYKFKNKIKTRKEIFMYLFLPTIFPLILFSISIASTPRRFAIAYILIIMICICYTISIEKIRKLFLTFIIGLIILQSFSIFYTSTSTVVDNNWRKNIYFSIGTLITNISINKFISGDLRKPITNKSMDVKIIELIYKNSKKYNFTNVDLSYLYPGVKEDIFTASLLNSLKANKTYITSLPVILDTYNIEWTEKRIKDVHAIFIVNPYGSMNITEEYHQKFILDKKEAKFPQNKFYSDLMIFYFSNKLSKDFNYKKIECLSMLSIKNEEIEGCLLINTNLVNKINEN
jgi:hypothetical protein